MTKFEEDLYVVTKHETYTDTKYEYITRDHYLNKNAMKTSPVVATTPKGLDVFADDILMLFFFAQTLAASGPQRIETGEDLQITMLFQEKF